MNTYNNFLINYRSELLNWINNKTYKNYINLNELKDGVACCLLTQSIFYDV